MSVIWKYADVDGDRLAVFTADIPGEGYGINIKTDPAGCSVPLNQIQPMLLAISRWASEIGSDDRDDAEREREVARQRWIGKLLELAEADPEPAQSWAQLVKLARQYGGRAVPRPATEEFASYREDYAHLPDAVWRQCPGELGIACYRPEGEGHDGAHDSVKPGPSRCPDCNGEREWSGVPGVPVCYFCGRAG